MVHDLSFMESYTQAELPGLPALEEGEIPHWLVVPD